MLKKYQHQTLCLGFCLLCLLNACKLLPVTPSAPRFVSDPQIKGPLWPTVHLARRLELTTAEDTRVTVRLISDQDERMIFFKSQQRKHVLPLLDLKPSTNYRVEVNITDNANSNTRWPQTLSFRTRPLAARFPQIKVSRNADKSAPGYTLFNVIAHGENKKLGGLLVIVDEEGIPVWYAVAPKWGDVRQLENGNLLGLRGNRIYEMDLLGERKRNWVPVGESGEFVADKFIPTAAFHHDVFPMQNGNVLSLSVETQHYLDYYTSTDDPKAPRQSAAVAGDLVLELGPDGRIVNRWSLLDMLDPYRIGYGGLEPYWDSTFKTDTKDWSHGNALIHNPDDDSIIVSLRHQDAIIKFDRPSGELKWILAPHENWDKKRFGDLLLKPVNPQSWFFPYHQHAPELRPDGKLLVYDNGSYRASPFSKREPPPPQGFSRVVEYKIDEQAMTVELTWQYGNRSNEIFYAGALGDADYQEVTDTVLITHGSLLKDEKQWATLLEVSYKPPHEIVYRLELSDKSADKTAGWRIYRAERIPSLYPSTMAIVEKIK